MATPWYNVVQPCDTLDKDQVSGFHPKLLKDLSIEDQEMTKERFYLEELNFEMVDDDFKIWCKFYHKLKWHHNV